MESLIGSTLGQYRLMEELGKGGMATVYKAYQPSLDRYVALKVLHLFVAAEEEFVARFHREAKAVATLRHPHIVQIHDFGLKNDLYYMVMEFIDGQTLKDRLEELKDSGWLMTLEEACHIAEQVADALDYAHRQGMIHRDVKPANIMLTSEGEAILTDFGLARMVEGVRYTRTGVVGTPDYMSPEQGQGLEIDGRTDIYSLGVVLYEMLTGQTPYAADTPLAVVMKHIQEPLPKPRLINPAIPEEIEQVILKATIKDPKARYEVAKDMARALRKGVQAWRVAKGTGSPYAAAIVEPEQALSEVADAEAELSLEAEATVVDTKIVAKCANCGANLTADMLFCVQCGTSVGESLPPAPPPVAEAPPVAPEWTRARPISPQPPAPQPDYAGIKCPRCQSLNQAGSEACWRCGMALIPEEPQPSKRPNLLVIGAVVGLLMILVIAVAAVTRILVTDFHGFSQITVTPTQPQITTALTQTPQPTPSATPQQIFGGEAPTPTATATSVPTAIPIDTPTGEKPLEIPPVILRPMQETSTPPPTASPPPLVTATPTEAPSPTMTASPTPLQLATPTLMTFVIATPTPTAVASYENKIAFKSDRDEGETLYIMNPDGSDQTRLDDEGVYHTAAGLDLISPDGKYKLTVLDNDGNWNIYLDAGQGIPLRITSNNADDYDPVWSPSGEHIAFVSWRLRNADIWMMDPDGRNEVPLTNKQGMNKHPSWSPNGGQIVFWSDRQNGRRQIWVMNADGTNQHNISNNDYNDWDPVWIKKLPEPEEEEE